MAPFDPKRFDDVALLPNNIDTVFGIPDTNLSGLLTYFSTTKSLSNHVVTANEGAAIALAGGYHLSTSRVALVYMQNSGLANALNPLQSIAAKEVFGIPMLLLIGWRGQTSEHEELQDALVGPRLMGNLETNDIPYEHMPTCIHQTRDMISRLLEKAVTSKTPVALLAGRGMFTEWEVGNNQPQASPLKPSPPSSFEDWTKRVPPNLPLSREGAIRAVVNQMAPGDVSVSSLGGISREYYMIRKTGKQPVARNFFCIGAMGHVFALSYGVSMGFHSGRIFCIEGDGSFIMHAGNTAVLAAHAPPNLIHVVIYNGVHASTGNHPVPISRQNLASLARGYPYRQKFFVDCKEGLARACEASNDSTLIIAAVNATAQTNLPSPSETLDDLKSSFMKSLL